MDEQLQKILDNRVEPLWIAFDLNGTPLLFEGEVITNRSRVPFAYLDELRTSLGFYPTDYLFIEIPSEINTVVALWDYLEGTNE